MKNNRKFFLVLVVLTLIFLIIGWFLGWFDGENKVTINEKNPLFTTDSGTSFFDGIRDSGRSSRLGEVEDAIKVQEEIDPQKQYRFNEDLGPVLEVLDNLNDTLDLKSPLDIDSDTVSIDVFPDYYVDALDETRKAILVLDAMQKQPPLPPGVGEFSPDILDTLYNHFVSTGYIDESEISLETEGDAFRLNQRLLSVFDDFGYYDSEFARSGERERAYDAAYRVFPEAWRGEETFLRGPAKEQSFFNGLFPRYAIDSKLFAGIVYDLGLVFLPKEAHAQYSDLIDNFVTIPDCWKSIGPQNAGARLVKTLEDGDNLYAPCCNCGIKYIPPYDIEFVYDCGTYDNLNFPINEDCNVLPLGCINLICFGEEANAIFDGPPGYYVPATAGWGGGFNTEWSFKCGCDSYIQLGPSAD